MTDDFTKVSKELEQYKTRYEQTEKDEKEASTHFNQMKVAVNEKLSEIEELKDETDDLKKRLVEATQDTAEMIET